MSTEGPYLVIAGAGSGKTRVLVFRTAYLVEKGVLPQNLLLLTFTRRAARQMLDRSSRILDDRCQQVSGGTFHSFAHRVLRRHAALLGLPGHFTILDQPDAETIIQMLRRQQGLHKLDKRFPKKQAILSVISKSVNKGTDIESVLYEEYPHFIEWTGAIERLRRDYQAYKRRMGLLDYDDLLVDLRDLLESRESLRREMSAAYPYIMVDEYQDTNKIQARIIRLLTCEHENIMVVGDDSQSIYSFRGAHFRNIIEFPKVYPQARVITLEENYRSSQPILDLTNAIIDAAAEKYEKVLFSRREGQQRPRYVDVTDEHEQSRYITRAIAELRMQGVPLNEIAVLFRSGWHSNDLEVELAASGIPFLKYGGQKFVEAAHIKDALCYLRIMHNPADEVSWQRVLEMIPGIGAQSASLIIRDVVQGGRVDEKWLKKNGTLKELLAVLRTADPQAMAPAELLKIALGHYTPLLIKAYDDYDKRINDLESLGPIAARYDGLEEFLADMALEPPEKSLVDAGRRPFEDSHLVLSTIHSAKGLEWHTVFLIFCAEGYLPSYRSMESEEAVEEERRLFYVAATRAKENLYLLRPQMDRSGRGFFDSSRMTFTRVSRFLGEGRILHQLVDFEGRAAAHSAWSQTWPEEPDGDGAWV